MRNPQTDLNDLLYQLYILDLTPADAIFLLSTYLREKEQEQGDLFDAQ